MVTITAKKHPLASDTYIASVEEGVTISDLLPDARPTVRVAIGDVFIDRELWPTTRLCHEDVVTVYDVPTGEFGRIIATMVIVYGAFYLGGVAAAGALGPLTAQSSFLMHLGHFLVQGAFTAAGMALTYKLFGVHTPEITDGRTQTNLTGIANRANPFGPLPKVYGTMRYFPSLATSWYTELAGDDQYLRAVLCLGYGPLQIGGNLTSDEIITETTVRTNGSVRIGETDISQYEDVEFRIGEASEIMSGVLNISEAVPDLLYERDDNLNSTGTWHTENISFVQTTAVDASEISVDVFFPRGLWSMDDKGNDKRVDVELSIEYSPIGANTWSTIASPNIKLVTESYKVTTGFTRIRTVKLPFGTNHQVRHLVKQGRTESWQIVNPSLYTVSPSGTYTFSANLGSVEISYFTAGDLVFSGPTKDSFRRSFRWSVATGQYDVRVTRMRTRFDANREVFSEFYWSSLRTIRTGDAWNGPSDVILMDVRLKASEHISGVIDQINVLATSVLPVWGGSSWSNQPTNNPAWHAIDALIGSQVKRPVPLNRLVLSDFKAWADWCAANNIEYHYVHDTDETIMQRVRAISVTGHASLSRTDGKYTIVRDVEQLTPVQVVSPRNATAFSSSREYRSLPHALRVKFIDTRSWAPSEAIVYRFGYDASTATIFEEIDTQGINSHDQAWHFGAYILRAAQLRPELFRVEMDFENLVATRGDTVRLAYDVIKVGLQQGRVVDVIADQEIVLDEAIAMDGIASYGIRVRKSDMSQAIYQVQNIAGLSKSIFTTVAMPSNHGILPGDLVLFGEHGRESLDAKITSIQYKENYAASLTLVDAASDIYNLGVPPIYDANISQPVDVTKLAPSPLVVKAVVSDESALIKEADGSIRNTMVVSFAIESSGTLIPAELAEIRYRIVNSDVWTYARNIVTTGNIRVYDVEDSSVIEFQLRSISGYGVPSKWTVSTMHTIIGKTSTPPDVTGFTAMVRDFHTYLEWDEPPNLDYSHFEIRVGTDWNTATFLATVYDVNYVSENVVVGLSDYLIKQFDIIGNESDNAVGTTLNVPQPSAVTLSQQVVDNNVLLKWSASVSLFPIRYYQVRKGPVFSTAEVIGFKDGLFTSVFEMVSNEYVYWVVPVDIKGNFGVPASITATVSQPPDYVLNVEWIIDKWRGTSSNLVDEFTGIAPSISHDSTALVGPTNPSQTYEAHFTSNSFTSPQSQITAGYPFYIQPANSPCFYEEELDYGAVLASSVISATLDRTVLDGSPVVTPTISTSEDGLTWTDVVGDWSILGISFRYVKIRLTVTGGPADIVRFDKLTVRLDSKLKSDAGSGTVSDANAGVVVPFNVEYIDVTSIVVTPSIGSNARYAIYDFLDIPYPSNFIVYLYDNDGNRVVGQFSWATRGF